MKCSFRVCTIPVLLAFYAFWPVAHAGLFQGPPWQASGGLVLSLLITGVALRYTAQVSPACPGLAALLSVAIAARLLLAAGVVPHGWASEFVVREPGTGLTVERIGPRTRAGAVIDGAVILSEHSPAFQFLNDGTSWQGGAEATRSIAIQITWTGYVWLSDPTDVQVIVHEGALEEIRVNENRVPPAAAARIPLDAGAHRLTLRYGKPAGEWPRVSVGVRSDTEEIQVYAEAPNAAGVARDRWARVTLAVVDVVVAGCALVWIVIPLGAIARRFSPRPGIAAPKRATNDPLVTVLPIVLFAWAGMWLATRGSALTVFLLGDDMRGYLSDARDVVLRGILMNEGQPLFQGEPFFFYPLYPYFVAASHVLFDESLYGLIFLQSVLLGITVGIMARLTREMFDTLTAWTVLALLILLAFADFVRYYTVSVFTDNLYYPLVAGGVLAMRHADVRQTAGSAAVAGIVGGLATLTRPSMFFVLPLFAYWLRRGSDDRLGRRNVVLTFIGMWLATVGLATFRNWIVSGRFVLLAESSLQVLFFLAPPGVDYRDYLPTQKPSVVQTVVAAGRMFLDHPIGVARVQAEKFVFMLGFTNVRPEYRLHPEFLVLSAGYLGWWLLGRGRPGRFTAAAHLTFVGHVLAFLVASPMTYGYKTMLTLMLMAAPFTGAFGWSVISRRAGIRGGTDGPRQA